MCVSLWIGFNYVSYRTIVIFFLKNRKSHCAL